MPHLLTKKIKNYSFNFFKILIILKTISKKIYPYIKIKIKFLLWYILLSLLDIISTIIGINMGFVERNIVSKIFLERFNVLGLFYVHIIGTLLIYLLL